MARKSPVKTGTQDTDQVKGRHHVKSKASRSLNIGTPFTGAVIGFLGASVLYQKHFPTWVPVVFSEYPVLFFSVFIVICGALGYIWSIVE